MGSADVWPQGGYWTYAKRAVISPPDRESSSCTLPNDLTPSILCKEWECLLDRVGGAAPELRDLKVGSDLSFSRALSESSGALSRLLSQGACVNHKSATIVHGDYKAANIFLDKSGHSTAVDFQWTGYGYGTTDLLYLLATSLSSSALEEPWQNWLDYYYHERGGESQEGLGRREDFGFQADLAMADYTRYVVLISSSILSPFHSLFPAIHPFSAREQVPRWRNVVENRSRVHPSQQGPSKCWHAQALHCPSVQSREGGRHGP